MHLLIKDFQDIYYLKLILKNYRFRVTSFFFIKKNPRYSLIVPDIYYLINTHEISHLKQKIKSFIWYWNSYYKYWINIKKSN